MSEEENLLRCSVAAVIYTNLNNGYTVLRVTCEDGSQTTVVGAIPMTAVGERLLVTGRWVSHATYGRQFEAEYLERLMPETREEIQAYLSSRAVRGVGAVTAARIVAAFGEQSLEVIENRPRELTAIPGISLKKAMDIHESFCRQVGVRRLMEYMTRHHLPAELAVRFYKIYGELSLDALRDDPYLLTDEEFGADFAPVDALALENGTAADDERRVEAGLLFELTHNLGNGHTFLPVDKLFQATGELLGLTLEVMEAGALRLQEKGRVVLSEVAGLRAVYLPEYYEAERYLTRRLRQMSADGTRPPRDLERQLVQIQRRLNIEYAPEQLEAIRSAAANRLFLLTGGPGTGKTTTLAGILALFDALGKKTLLAAPTGRAAKRLSELTGREASTIHRLLEVDVAPETGKFRFLHDESQPLGCDVLIVDETSMVDLQLMAALVRALPPACTLILVGDPNQLPSVGAGNILSDLLRSGTIPSVCLTEIFRQARESLIIMNAHAVLQGRMPELRARDRDFFFLRRAAGEDVVQTVCDLCARRLPENMGIPSGEIQVLSPTRRGEAGTYALNTALQRTLNPARPDRREKQYGDYIFREGDRVMQIRNNYEVLWKRTDGAGVGAGIFNGDVGVILSIDPEQETLLLRFDDREALYSYQMLCDLEPAYAMTVHKSQGSEYRAVILTAFRSSPYLLTRSVLYTALTRARDLLIVVGSEEVLAAMVENDRRQRRYSGLKWRLCQETEA